MLSNILKCSIFAAILLLTLSTTTEVEGRNLRPQGCTPKSKTSKNKAYKRKTTTPVLITPITEAPKTSVSMKKKVVGGKTPETSKSKAYKTKTTTPITEAPKTSVSMKKKVVGGKAPESVTKTTPKVVGEKKTESTKKTTPKVVGEKKTESMKKKDTKVVGGDYSMARKMLVLVNAERSKLGLKALCLSKKLTSAAQKHSEDQARNSKMTHNGSNGDDAKKRMEKAGFDVGAYAENVDTRQTAKEAMVSWMESPVHKANILSKKYKFFGAGKAPGKGKKTNYWTQKFAMSKTEKCE